MFRPSLDVPDLRAVGFQPVIPNRETTNIPKLLTADPSVRSAFLKWRSASLFRRLLPPPGISFGDIVSYLRTYGSVVIPDSVDGWEYRELLRALDRKLMRALKTHGALMAAELVAWVNDKRVVRMSPDKTGIGEMEE